MGDFPYLEWLTRNYKSKAEKQEKSWINYVKAHGLANACVVRDAITDRQQLVYDIENSWYDGNHPISFDEHQILIGKHKKLLFQYRDNVARELSDLKAAPDAFDMDEILSEENIANVFEFSTRVFVASQHCSEGFVQFSAAIIQSSVNLLEKLNDEAPCPFAVIGLGSVARGEATPYSDLEYGFVIANDNKIQYFKRLAVDSYFRIGNIGETPLKCFGFSKEELNEEEFTKVPTGFRIDGISKNAGNIPTGLSENEYRLTFTVEGFMEKYKKALFAAPGKLVGDLSDLLSTLVLIYANKNGRKLHDNVIKDRSLFEEQETQNNAFIQKKRLKTLTDDVENYDFLPKSTAISLAEAINVKVKADVFRYPTLLATNLKISLRLHTTHPWDTYNKLLEMDALLVENYFYISIVLALSIYIRTSSYVAMGTQTEYLSVFSTVTGQIPDRYYVHQKLFVVLGRLLLPIKTSIALNIQSLLPSLNLKGTNVQAALKSQLMKFEIDRDDFMLEASVFHFVGREVSALKKIDQALNESVGKDCDQFIQRICKKYNVHGFSSTAFNHVATYGILQFKVGSFETACRYFMRLVSLLETRAEESDKEVFKVNLAINYNNLATVYAAQNLPNEALESFIKSLYLLKVVYGTESIHPEIARCHGNIGAAYFLLNKFEKTLKHQEIALKMWITLYGVGVVHLDVASCYSNIGLAHCRLNHPQLALQYLSKGLNMKKAVHGYDANHPDIATSYSNIGTVLGDIGEYTESLRCHIISLNMKKAIYGTDSNHPDIAISYHNIARAHMGRMEYNRGLLCYDKAISMLKSTYGADIIHPEIAKNYSGMGGALLAIGEFSKSLEYLQKALQMKRHLFENVNHSDIATCYENMGSAHCGMGDYRKAMESHLKALEIKKSILGDIIHPDIATSYNNIGNVHFKAAEYKAALECYMKALKMRSSIYGAESYHPDIASCYNNIGGTHAVLGDFELAIVYQLQALDIIKAKYGPRHPQLSTICANISLIYYKMGEREKAEEYQRMSLFPINNGEGNLSPNN